MTAMTGSTGCPPDRLAATRDGLHRVAAARTWRQIGTAAEAAAFFRDARTRVTTPARRTS